MMFYQNGWGNVADDENFIVVVPNGADDDGGEGRSWNAGGSSLGRTPKGQLCTKKCDWDKTYCYDSCGKDCKRCQWTTCLDDVSFTQAMLAKVTDELCVDENRTYATGFSNGAMMAYQLAVSLPDVFAAVAPVEGSVMNGFYETLTRKQKHLDQPISVLDIHGTQDTTIPANKTMSDDYFKYETVDHNVMYWTRHNNCTGEGQSYQNDFTGGEVSMWCTTAAEKCASNTMVSWCSWEGPHGWPIYDDFHGTRMIWQFF